MPPSQAARNSVPGFANYSLSSIGSVVNFDTFPFTPIDELPRPHLANPMLVSPLGNIFSQATVPEPERLSDVGSITLTPVPQHHSSLYRVLEHGFQPSPTQGTMPSATSSVAHALELQEQPTQLVPPPCMPAFGNRWDLKIGPSETSLSGSQIISTPLVAMTEADARLTVPKLPALPVGSTCQVQVPSPVSCAMPPRAPTTQAQNGSAAVTPLRGHTVARSLPEVTTNDHDTLPRLRKVSTPSTSCSSGVYERLRQRPLRSVPAPPGPSTAKEQHSAAPSSLSSLPLRPSSLTDAQAPAAAASSHSRRLFGHKLPRTRAKLACLFCHRRKIQCRPKPVDNPENACL